MAAVLQPPEATPAVVVFPTPSPAGWDGAARSGEVVLTGAMRLVQLARNPAEVVCVDRMLGEVVLLDALTRAGHMVSRWTSRLELVEPGVVRDDSGAEHILHVSPISLILSLRTRAGGQ